ncbi:hypothetical protein Tco_1196667, partial [Tanacetum coccineum]
MLVELRNPFWQSTKVPIVEEVGTQEFSVKDVVLEDYVSSGEDVKQYNGEFDESASSDGQFFFDDEGIDTKYDVYMDLPFNNIGVPNLVSDDVLEGENVDIINADGFDSDPGNDEETNYRKRRLAELRTEMEGVINASGQWKRNLKLYKNDGVRIRARGNGKVLVFTMSQGTRPTGPNCGMEAGPSGSSGPTTRSKKGRIHVPMMTVKHPLLEIKHRTYKFLSEKIFKQVRVNPDILVKAVQNQLQHELESTNPNSTVKIAVERNTDPSLPTRVFQRIYVCLGALKLGFRGRRDLLGLDGAFMKSKSSWCWFLQFLGDEIDLHPNSNFTFISDRQKGWRGQTYKDLLWRAASAINVRDFEKCRAKTNLLLNICEVFNGKIVGITLLEYIGEYCMKRIVNVQGVIDKCTGPLTLTATRIMESIKK